MLERVLPRAIALRIRLEPSAPMIIDGDEGQWHQALLNLALNARDAMPDGGRLELAAHRDGDYAVLEVADDGAGMSPDTRARAFEPFFTTKGTQGTGLGLAHGYAVARAHGAILELTSELGRGTTVRLRIAAMALPAAVAAPASAPATALVGAAVIVDDEPAVRRSTSRLASRLGLTVEAVASAAEALEALARGPAVAYLVTDLSMPEVDGLALARTARARWPALGIVVVSGTPAPRSSRRSPRSARSSWPSRSCRPSSARRWSAPRRWRRQRTERSPSSRARSTASSSIAARAARITPPKLRKPWTRPGWQRSITGTPAARSLLA
jgi:CheY-like chemotaxis protein